ncbi:MAG: hypothetical protein ACRC8Y_10010 [Chroococcales cyanobacterium]
MDPETTEVVTTNIGEWFKPSTLWIRKRLKSLLRTSDPETTEVVTTNIGSGND